MKILDSKKRKDYYDISLSLGVDLSRVFVRDVVRGPVFPLSGWSDRTYFGEEPKGKYPKFVKSHYYGWGHGTPSDILGYIYILVAGKLYGGIKAWNKDSNGKEYNTIIWTKEDLEKYDAQFSIWSKAIRTGQFKKYDIKKEKKNYESALKVLEVKGDDILSNWAIENNIVIAVCGNHTKDKTAEIEQWSDINPLLKDYEFQKILDPYSCYQELDMFISNLAINEVIPEMADKDKIASHGFDSWSFRRHKLDNKDNK